MCTCLVLNQVNYQAALLRRILACSHTQRCLFSSGNHIGYAKPKNSLQRSNKVLTQFQFDHYVESVRRKSTENSQPKRTGKELDVARESPYAGLSTADKVKEAGKDASYTVVILVGVGLMGLMFYTVGKELFSSQSPAGIYGKALKKCQENDEVCVTVGEPITGHGTSGSRRRKQHVSSHEFMVNGVKHMRVVFKIEGPYRKGTVHVEVYQDENKKYQYKYLVVDLDGYPSKQIVIENNR